MLKLADIKLATIGLGCVDLQLAVELGKKRPVIGLDSNQPSIDAVQVCHDSTLE